MCIRDRLLFSVLVCVFNCLLVLVIRPLFLLLYNVTPETYEAASTIIGVLACLQLVLGIDVTCICLLYTSRCV